MWEQNICLEIQVAISIGVQGSATILLIFAALFQIVNSFEINIVVKNRINLKELGILINYSAPAAFLSQCP